MKEKELKFIWGIISRDYLSDQPASEHTLNDFDIYYDPDTKRYNYDIEAIYNFKDSEFEEVIYLKMIFKEFTKWMRKKGYNTNYKPILFSVFCEDHYQYGFESIEQLYAHFKLMCMGFALMNSTKKTKKQED